MSQIFSRKDHRKKWGGYRSHFYSHEYRPIGTKPRELLHIHFIGPNGEIKIYLLSSKYLEIEKKWGNISDQKKAEIKEFVQTNYQDIIKAIEKNITPLFPNWKIS